MINVTKPYLPSKDIYDEYVSAIWDRNWLTNNGPLVNELEYSLKEYLGLERFKFTSNGTVPLQLAIKALNCKGEIITTPFSYVATTNAIVWESCTPVFVDISESDFNINPSLVEQAITEHTSAIMATHVFGNPCDVLALEQISKAHNIPIIYDAAHCFGTRYKDVSVLNYGDISTISFHATKLFHTVEGGGFVCNGDVLNQRMSELRNFGHTSATTFSCAGINGKNSEFHAAMGLAVLREMNTVTKKRIEQYRYYADKLAGMKVRMPKALKGSEPNYSYVPVVFENEEVLHEVVKTLQNNYINPRRYFYPSLNTLSYVDGGECPVSESVAGRILCLPVFHDLSFKTIDLIVDLIKKSLK